MKSPVLSIFFIVLGVTWSAGAQGFRQEQLIVVTSPALVVMTPTTLFRELQVGIGNLTGDAVTFGTVDPDTGQVVGGQYLVFFEIELIDAPVRLSGFVPDLQGDLRIPVNLNAQNPSFSGVFALNLPVLIPNSFALLLGFRVSPESDVLGTVGDVRLRAALLESPDERPVKSPGMSRTIHLLIHDTIPTWSTSSGTFLRDGDAFPR